MQSGAEIQAGRRSFFANVASTALAPRYCVWDMPTRGPAQSLVVHVPPFAEEMNKCRRMVALQSHALVARGCGVLRMDLFGCGDSAGDIADASLDIWIRDVLSACEIAHRLHREAWPAADVPRLRLWAVRAGALIAAAAARQLPDPVDILLWQPQVSGKQVLQQFLRVRLASAMGSGAKAADTKPMDVLAQGRNVDVGGYVLSPSLASALAASTFDPPASPGRLDVLEVGAAPGADLLPATVAALARWRAAGWPVSSQVVGGKPFWSTVEIEEVPELIASTARLCRS